MGVSRRRFLSLAAQSTGTAALLGGCYVPETTAVNPGQPDAWEAKQSRFAPAICEQCPGGCGLKLRIVNDAVVGLTGNPLHPVNRGRLCPRAFGLLQLLNGPDRIPGPMMRPAKGEPLRPVPWDTALDLLAARLRPLLANDRSDGLAMLAGHSRGIRRAAWSDFASGFGTPWVFQASTEAETISPAARAMQSAERPLAADPGTADMVLSFGVDLFETWSSPVFAARQWAARRRQRDRLAPFWVYVGPRLSHTAAMADRRVQAPPGSESGIALALAHLILTEHAETVPTLVRTAEGFESVRTLLVDRFPPETAAAATGVPSAVLAAVAADLAHRRPAVVLGPPPPVMGPSDPRAGYAIHALNALIGALGGPYGLRETRPLPVPAVSGLPDPSTVAGDPLEALLAGLNGTPAQILMLARADPFGQHPLGPTIAEAAAETFVVSFAPVWDGTTEIADLVLPDDLPSERWADDPVDFLPGFHAHSLAAPAVPRRVDSRDTVDVLTDLADRLGDPMAEAMGWESHERAALAIAEGLYETGLGGLASLPGEDVGQPSRFRRYRRDLLERGAWWRELDPRSEDAAAAVRLTFRPLLELLQAGPALVADTARTGYPLRLALYRLSTQPDRGSAGQPWLSEQAAVHLPAPTGGWAELHPETAAPLGVLEGQPVWIASPSGRVRLTAHMDEAVLPTLVQVPLTGASLPDLQSLLPPPGRTTDPVYVRLERA